MREFNVTGICVPNMHYMVDTSDKIEQIYKLVEQKKYFTINRGRQYGKTTTIGRLKKRLPDDYICVSISFQGTDDEMFANAEGFCQGLLELIHNALMLLCEEEASLWIDENVTDFAELDYFITKRCQNKKIVLIINKVDEAANYNLFVMFLKMLRAKFQMRTTGQDCTFHSVILTSVRDVRNLEYISGGIVKNSPWNIATDFNIDMSFSAPEIETMLVEYEKDYHTGMNISEIAKEIRFYTSGYPYLVSRICQLIETNLDRNWTVEGVQEAIKLILKEKSTLFDDMIKKVEENQELSNLMYDLTVGKIKYPYNVDDPVMKFGLMFGFLAKETNGLQIHNKIFEIRITDYFIAKNLRKWR